MAVGPDRTAGRTIDRRLAVAPMLDWTDRHCRYFLRLITRRTLLYTEMVTTGALIHGDRERHLGFDPAEHPLGVPSEPDDVGQRVRGAEQIVVLRQLPRGQLRCRREPPCCTCSR